MRIGIDARFLTHPQRGGFKTYTQNLIMSLSEVDSVNDYFVYLDRLLPDDKLPQKRNWHYKVVRGDFPVLGMPLREQLFLKRQIIKDRLDVVHFLCNTAPVNLTERYVVTLHDTIQVTTKNRFELWRGLLSRKRWAAAYSKWVINKSIKSASRIITVSDFERKQIGHQFNVSYGHIAAIHLAPNPIFKPASSAEKSAWRSKLSQMHGIHKKFIFGVGYEARKNIDFLIEIYSRLTSEYEELDLVIVCAEEKRRSYFKKLSEELGLAGKIFILGSLPAEELAVLYNLAEAFIYPSERESFGLPPLEAISCGAPTIAMNVTSMPEILEDGALLIDGKDPQVWSDAFRHVVDNEEFRLQLIYRGLERASKFNWQRCARETIQVYSDIVETS